MLPVFGEPLLHQTLRRFQEAIPGLQTTVMLHPDADIDIPDYGYVVNHKVLPRELLGQANKLLSSREFWDPARQTIIAFGDVYFSDAAIDAVLATRTDAIEWIGRSGPGTMTYWPYSEIFAVTFPAARIIQLVEAIAVTAAAANAGTIEEAKAWDCYRQLEGIPLTEWRMGGHFTEIDDLTQDFDCPECYSRWCQASGSPQSLFS